MATLSPTESRRMYSWWWDSHISPKNSKWLRENLTDMDSKVKAMIKLIEEDADSFARRAEMYYEKRPELMKLVEGFYRAYRALAERYGHATGAIRQPIAEAFPDEVLFDPDELQEGTCGISLSHFEAETETQSTKNDLSRSEAGNEPWFLQHKQSLELVSKLESEFLRADKAETEVGNLKRALSISTDEKDSAFEKICNLEHEISCIQEEAQRLNEERDGDIARLKDAEERYILKLGAQNEELREKQKEVGRLRACVQEERERFMEAETAFQNLQHMYSHSQEELRSLTAELQNVGQILKDTETRNQGLQDEVKEVKEENRSLSERNLSLDEVMRKMQDETSKLRAIKLHLEEKIGLRVDQRNALQKEVYCLQGELNRLNKKLCMLIEQVDSVGLNPECLGSSVKELQDESSKLREICQSERSEKAALLEKLEILKNSLSDMSVELEEHRTKVKALEESCHLLVGDKLSLVAEKDAVVSQLQSMSQNFEKLSEKHGFLENSFSYAHFELEELREKFRGLENSCQFLDNENVGLISERSTLASQFEITQQKVEDLENKYTNLEERHCGLENDKESVLQKLEELSLSLDVEKKEHERFTQSSETRLVSLETQILLLQEESSIRKREIEGGLDEALNAQIEIFILQRCVQDLEEKNSSLLIDCEEFSRMSKLSEQLVSELQHENLEQQMEFKSLNDHIRNLRKINEEMTLKLSEQDHKERLLAAGTEDLHEKLLALQRAYRDLKRENFKVLEQKRSLEEQNHSLEEENCVNLGEALSLSSLSVVLMNFAAEKSVDQNAIRERVNFLEKNLEMLKIENFHLKEYFENSENQLKTEKFVSDQLKHEIAYNKDLLYQKGVEILEAEQKLIAMQNEKRVWHKMVEDLKREFDEANMKREDHAQQILKLAQDNDRWNKENESLHEAIRRLEANLQKSHMEHEATKTREESLSSDLKEGRNEVKLCQNQAAALFSELQAYAVREIFFEEKIHELSEACENFTERVSTLEGENGGLKSQLASYLPAIAALKDSITSLENHTISHTKFHSADNLQTKDVEGSHPDAKSCHIYGLRDLHELKTRILVADKVMREMDRVAEQESLKSNAKLEAAMRQIEESQSQSDTSRENVQTRNHQAIEDLKLLKPMPEICEAGTELLTKDIVLDQISKCSSYRRRRKRANARGADKALEIWQATDQKNSIDLTVGEGKNAAAAAPTGKQLPSMGVMIEKELGMDLLEISKGFRAQTHQGGNKRKILERLASDAQKLTNLGITVQDLKRKMENTEKGKKGKSIEYDTVKLQLEEAEETIQKLFSINGKLTKSVQDNFSSRNGKSKMEPEESGSVRRRRVSEQARRGSEKIMQLQLEVQKIQFILLKLDDEKEHKARIRIPERKPRVLLRDYLSGGFRTNVKQKKARCCSCVQPPTRGD